MSARRNDVYRNGLWRSVLLAGIVSASCGFAWMAWPRPAVDIEIAKGGETYVVTPLFKKYPLPDTVRIHGKGPARVRIANHDDSLHLLGIFAVGSGKTQTFTIERPGVYSGICSAHPGREITYILKP